jgi:U-box domain
MEDPVMDSCGHTYERRAILGYLKQWTRRAQQQQQQQQQQPNDNNACRCPFSQKPLTVRDLIPNHALGERIDKWRWQQEFDCSQLSDCDCDDGGNDLSRFADVELQKGQGQGQASFDESQQNQAAHVDASNEDDDDDDDEEEADRDHGHRSRNRGLMRSYWGQRRARHQRQKRYAPVSQKQQPPSSPGGAMSLSSGSTRSDDAGASFYAHKSVVAEWHPELLLLPQELHILSFVQERSERERQKHLRDRRVKCARRCVATLVVLVLLAGAALGLVLVADHWRSWSAASGSSGEGEPSSQERDEGRETNSTTTDPPARRTYEYERR